jgi:hypothetical protein
MKYYNTERQCLEHFRFPEIFLRQTKKAYISFVTHEILEIVEDCAQSSKITYNGIRLSTSLDSLIFSFYEEDFSFSLLFCIDL